MPLKPIPPEVAAWVKAHKGSKRAFHVVGAFQRYSGSRSSACWGQPSGGTPIDGGYRVAVCQPSPDRVDGHARFLYDYIKE